jgi:hypothetical protein
VFFFSGSNIAFYVLYPFVTYLLTLPPKKRRLAEETSKRTFLVFALMRYIMADDNILHVAGRAQIYQNTCITEDYEL